MAYAHVMPDGSYWAATGNGSLDVATERHQSTAVETARAWLTAHGGGELSVHGDDGRVRRTETIPAEISRGGADTTTCAAARSVRA